MSNIPSRTTHQHYAALSLNTPTRRIADATPPASFPVPKSEILATSSVMSSPPKRISYSSLHPPPVRARAEHAELLAAAAALSDINKELTWRLQVLQLTNELITQKKLQIETHGRMSHRPHATLCLKTPTRRVEDAISPAFFQVPRFEFLASSLATSSPPQDISSSSVHPTGVRTRAEHAQLLAALSDLNEEVTKKKKMLEILNKLIEQKQLQTETLGKMLQTL